MKPIEINDVIAAVGGELVAGDPRAEITGISTDTRTIQPGDLFFALIGENGNGHKFVPMAVSKGAAAVVVSEEASTDAPVIKVADTLVALGDLAAWYRRSFSVRSVAITGSVGKTSTKEMIAAVLSANFNVLKNEGNFNNEIGVPLTIFKLQPEHEILVQELAMRLPGEIAELADMVRPDIGVVTNIGLSHIERLGSQDAIAAAKTELLEALPIDGIAILNANDSYFEFLSKKPSCDVISFGIDKGDIRAESITLDDEGRPSFTVVIGDTRVEVALPVVGEHSVPNALAAVAVGLSFGMPLADIVPALESLSPPDKRANVFDARGGYKVIDDTYNASPASVASALKTLAAMKAGRKIAVLGDMLELGDFAGTAHRKIGKVAAESGLAMLVTVGELGRAIATGAHMAGFDGIIEQFATSDDAASALKDKVIAGDIVLIKGSRAMKMENIVEVLK